MMAHKAEKAVQGCSVDLMEDVIFDKHCNRKPAQHTM